MPETAVRLQPPEQIAPAGLRPGAGAQPRRHRRASEPVTQHLLVANFVGGNLDVVREMLDAPNTLLGLGDGGAHAGIMCDATATSYTLTHWTRDRAKDRARGSLFPVAWAIKRLTADNAIEVDLRDRGVLKVDINVLDYDNMRLRKPEVI